MENSPLIVAEMSANHNQSLDRALAIVDAAAKAGAHAVKLQTYTPDTMTLPGVFTIEDENSLWQGMDLYELYQKAHTPWEWHKPLFDRARELGITAFSTPFDATAVEFLEELGNPIYKVASFENTDIPLMGTIARTGKPVILSTGLGTVEEIDQAVAWVRDESGDADIADRLVLLHCISAYPTPMAEATLLSVPFLAERYDVPVGYSNHVPGIDACLAAIALGAQVIEAHFTDQKTGRTFRDHELSLEPDEMAELVRRAPAFKASRGTWGKSRQPSELPLLDLVRKGLVAARDLPAGHELVRDDLMYARPATGFEAADMDRVLGRRLTQPLAAGACLSPDALEG